MNDGQTDGQIDKERKIEAEREDLMQERWSGF
jgi:hypothetical protein